MTGIRGRADDGPATDDITPWQVQQQLADARTLRLERADDPARSAEAVRTGPHWQVRVATADGPVTGRAPNTDAVYDLLRSWAADDGWWAEAFAWTPADDRTPGA